MLLVMKMFNRWVTFETGVVGEENEPEIEHPEEEEATVEQHGQSVGLGFSLPETV